MTGLEPATNAKPEQVIKDVGVVLAAIQNANKQTDEATGKMFLPKKRDLVKLTGMTPYVVEKAIGRLKGDGTIQTSGKGAHVTYSASTNGAVVRGGNGTVGQPSELSSSGRRKQRNEEQMNADAEVLLKYIKKQKKLFPEGIKAKDLNKDSNVLYDAYTVSKSLAILFEARKLNATGTGGHTKYTPSARA